MSSMYNRIRKRIFLDKNGNPDKENGSPLYVPTDTSHLDKAKQISKKKKKNRRK